MTRAPRKNIPRVSTASMHFSTKTGTWRSEPFASASTCSTKSLPNIVGATDRQRRRFEYIKTLQRNAKHIRRGTGDSARGAAWLWAQGIATFAMHRTCIEVAQTRCQLSIRVYVGLRFNIPLHRSCEPHILSPQ